MLNFVKMQGKCKAIAMHCFERHPVCHKGVFRRFLAFFEIMYKRPGPMVLVKRQGVHANKD